MRLAAYFLLLVFIADASSGGFLYRRRGGTPPAPPAEQWWETNAVLAVSYDTGFVDDSGHQSLLAQSSNPRVVTNASTNVIFKADLNFLRFSDTSFTPGLNPLTVSMWVYMTNVSVNSCIFDMGTNQVRSRYYVLYYDLGSGRHLVPGTAGGGSNFDTGTNLIANTWYHIVSILHGSTNTLFIDGHLTRTTTGAVNDGFGLGNRTLIGNDDNTNYPGWGYMDEFQVITGVVTLVDAGRIYTNAIGRHGGTP